MKNNKQKIGVFGLGSIGLRHATNLIDLGFDVIAFDPDTDRQEIFKEKGGYVATKEDLLSQVDMVVIASPNKYHLEDIKTCIENNKHAFVEKPLSHKMDGLEEIVKTAKAKNLTISVGMNMRLNPAIQHLKQKVISDTLGKIAWGSYNLNSYLPDWRPHQDHKIGYAADPKTGGIIFDIIHGFDLIHFLIGEYKISGASARSSGLIDIPSDDCADILCSHTNGVTSHLHMDYITKQKKHELTIAFETGIACVNISTRNYTFTDVDGTILENKTFSDTSVNDDYKQELLEFIEQTNGNDCGSCSIDEAVSILKNVIDARHLAGLPS